MNLAQFAELRPGDKVRNDMTHSDGEVTDVSRLGVSVAWAGNRAVAPFTYSPMSTAWFHWSKVDDRPEGERIEPQAAAPESGTEQAS